MKICSRCHQQKEERDFQIRRASRDGLTAACRACLAEYDKERAGLPHRVSARREYQSSERGRERCNAAKKAVHSEQPMEKKSPHHCG